MIDLFPFEEQLLDPDAAGFFAHRGSMSYLKPRADGSGRIAAVEVMQVKLGYPQFNPRGQNYSAGQLGAGLP